MYTMIIKGDEYAAFAACDAHAVEIASIVRHPQFDECIVTTPALDGVLTVLTEWFCEHSGAPPAPAGTLMWYGPANAAPLSFLPDNATADGHAVPRGWDKVEGGTDA